MTHRSERYTRQDGSASTFDRRAFLRATAAFGGAVALGSTEWLQAANAAPHAQYGTLDLRLSWIENAQFAGEYVSDTYGYYKAAGFSGVKLMPGGPTASPIESDVATGHAFIAPSQPDLTAQANLKGAKLKIVGALYQKNPFAILSIKTRKPIPNPKAMIGKKVGVQASNMVIWNAFLAANKINAGDVHVVPVQFDLTPLTSGQVDGWFAFYNNEPLELQVKGYKTTAFLLADYGYPLSSQTYIVTDDNLKSKRDEIKAFLTAEIKGWKRALANPALGAKLTVTKYGKTLGLDQKEQSLEIAATRKLAITPDTQKHGLLTMTPKLIAENISTLERSGIKIAASDLFDASLIDEVYKENPSLR